MIRYTEEIIVKRHLVLLPLTDHDVAHVKATKREMHKGILFLLHSLETFKVDNQYRRRFEDLKLLDGLLVKLASAAKPSILLRELLRCHKLPKAIIDGDFISLRLVQRGPFLRSFRVKFVKLFRSNEVLIESPAFFGVEVDLELKFQIIEGLLFLRCAHILIPSILLLINFIG